MAAGDPVLSPAVTRRLMEHAAGTAADTRRTRARTRVAALNDREREVAVAVGRGLANAAIAAELFMSVATVKTHVSRILAKLDLNNRVQVALLVYDAGLLDGNGEDTPDRRHGRRRCRVIGPGEPGPPTASAGSPSRTRSQTAHPATDASAPGISASRTGLRSRREISQASAIRST